MKDRTSGIIAIDKPAGRSSAFVARLIGRKVGAKKVGHLGTLDPFATGVLPVALNDATKLINYVNSKQKTYVFEMVFGEKTDTGDLTGSIIEASDHIPSRDEILDGLPSFIGEIYQIPPSYSAIKIDGKRAYELARKGEKPLIKSRKITIFSIKYIKQSSERSHVIEASVSPGTYIRTLAEDIAISLNSVSYVRSLRRTQDGIFTIENAITIDELEEKNYNMEHVLCELEDILDDIPVVFIDSQNVIDDLRNGRKSVLLDQIDGTFAISSSDGFFAIVECFASVVYLKRVVRQSY